MTTSPEDLSYALVCQDNVIKELQKALKATEVCGTCIHEEWDYNGDACSIILEEQRKSKRFRMDDYIVELSDTCHLTPSQWEGRRS